MLRPFALVILMAACGNGGPPHWKDQPTQTFSGTTGGHAYSIDMPKGTEKSKIESKHHDEYNYHSGGRIYPPAVSVGWNDKKQTLEDALAHEKEPIVDKSSDAGGWVYVTENSSYKGASDYIITGQRFAGDGAFACDARVFPMVKGEDVKTNLVSRVEKMCASLRAK